MWYSTCTPRMPKMTKNVMQMRTMLPMGFRLESSVCTTSFSPGARLMTLRGRSERSSRKTCRERDDAYGD